MAKHKKKSFLLARDAGISFIEVMVGAAILGIIVVAMTRFFAISEEARSLTESSFACQDEINRALQTMESELEMTGQDLSVGSITTNTPSLAVIAAPQQLNNPEIVFFDQDRDKNGSVSEGDYWVRYRAENYRLTREVRCVDKVITNKWADLKPLSPPQKIYLTSPNVRIESLTFTIYNSGNPGALTNEAIATIFNTAASQIAIKLILKNRNRNFVAERRVLLKTILFGGGS